MFHPNRIFQAGLNQREARRQRENNSLSLRRKSRELKLQTKRKKVLNNRNTTTNQITPGNTNLNNSYNFNQLLSGLPLYVDGCHNANPSNIHISLIKIRQLLSFGNENPPIKPIIDSGILPRIIHLLQVNNYNIQFEACWCIANLASANSAPEYNANVIRSGALIPLLNILTIPKYPLQQIALWAIGNIAGESRELRNMILKHNILQLLMNLISKPFNTNNSYYYKSDASIAETSHAQYLQLLSTFTWTISNLCRGMENENDCENMEYKLLIIKCINLVKNIKNKFIISERIEININICWSIQYIVPVDYKYPNKLLNKMYELDIFKELICLLNGTPNEYKPIIKLIGNMFAGDSSDCDTYTKICIDYGILKQFSILLNRLNNNNNLQILKEICWSISNITVNYEFLNNVINENIFPILCELLLEKSTIANEALWAIANALQTVNESENNNNDIIEYLCNKNQCNLIEYLCNYNKKYFINYQIHMEQILNVALECIENILLNGEKYIILFEEYNGCYFLEYMQTNENLSEKLYEKIVWIVKRFFGTDDNEKYYNQFNDNNNRQCDSENGNNIFEFGCDSENGNDIFEF